MSLKRSTVKELLASQDLDREVLVKGWVRSRRGNKYVQFIIVNDGSTIHTIQAVADAGNFPEESLKDVSNGAAVAIRGKLVASQGKGQAVEIQATEVTVLGAADAEAYPLQKKATSLEHLRDIAHLRPRTNTFGAVLRIRHALAFAVHQYFNDHGFYYVHTPIITGSDAEGAGQMFRVTTLPPEHPPRTEDGSVDFTQDFFGKQTNLTVSGQLEGELAAMALGSIYTFGPTFRAENSNTARHLAEFWMIEPEVAFNELEENMDLAEDFLQSLVRYALANCADDLAFLNEQYDKELLTRLNFVVDNAFQRLTYTEAVEILKSAKQKFEFPVDWGTDLQSEHERYLVEKHFKKPVILTNYPKDIKAFYMKLDDDGRTVRAMDVLFPGIGEIIGGSQREEDYTKLTTRMAEMHVPAEDLDWYLDTRRFGSAPHAGFGLGFERLVLFVTGMSNIRDVIPFPRYPKNAAF
ncbi:asparagine--tRNA ligase [Microvirga sp. STS02]|uniref:asparagine--tRNA ligase n=1 Tax=Hymenobacter negativus TaxID=2795026 RepID=UPI0018DCA388|nr:MULTISPECIES: asparagine--tRNA ligase [Bacteria]MBH8570854.1 asparagine--tRNA ligase [Hymenobacter negativus]MBR7210591.1 asparagine--tRNA ligase [Microvirga sp. STS02]